MKEAEKKNVHLFFFYNNLESQCKSKRSYRPLPLFMRYLRAVRVGKLANLSLLPAFLFLHTQNTIWPLNTVAAVILYRYLLHILISFSFLSASSVSCNVYIVRPLLLGTVVLAVWGIFITSLLILYDYGYQ